MTHDQIIQTLKDDNEYYNGLGRSYLSNSDIGVLLNNPKLFKRKNEPTLAMLQGSYFHTACLEPHKLKGFPLVEASSRTTNIYKDACKANNQPFMLLIKEAEEVNDMVITLRGNKELSKLVWDSGIKYEVPAIGEIEGLMWKGKADIINGDHIYDLKTTTSLDDFKYSAKKYNYDSQAYIYNKLFDKELSFIVIEKGSNKLGYFECSFEFLESGRMKVEQAIAMYEKFYGNNVVDDVSQYYISKVLF